MKAAASELALRKLSKADAIARNPDTLANILEDVIDGIAESWRACPHGTPVGEHCSKCPAVTP